MTERVSDPGILTWAKKQIAERDATIAILRQQLSDLMQEVAGLKDALKPFAEAWNQADALAADKTSAAGLDGIPGEYLAFVATSHEGAMNGDAWPLFKFGDLRHAAQLTRADAGEVGSDG